MARDSPQLLPRGGTLAFLGQSQCVTNVSTIIPVVPHKAVAEVSNIANYRRLVTANHGSQSKSTDESRSGWRQRSVVAVVIVVAK